MGKPNLDELIKISRAVFKDIERAISKQDRTLGNDAIKKLQLILGTAVQLEELTYDEVEIVFPKNTFCFSGIFAFGSREDCSTAVTARGGTFVNNVSSKVDYLVVGGIPSPEWAYGNYGHKIDRALELRKKGLRPAIISESHWRESLDRGEF